MPRRAAAVLLAALAVLVAGCGSDSAGDGDTLKIGVINPFSGDFAVYGEDVTRGYQLAVDTVNAEGGIDGRRIELLRGDAASGADAITAATRLATKEQVELFVGTYISAVATTASDTAARRNRFYWETNATANELTTYGLPNFMRFGPRGADFAEQSVASLESVAEQLGKEVSELRVYLEHEDSVYGTSIAGRQEELLKEQGIEPVGVGTHAAAATDVNDAILKAKAARPDVWISTGYVPDSNLLLRTARGQGFDPPAKMLVGTGDTAETLEAVGADELRGTLVVSYPSGTVPESFGPGSRGFLDAYRAKYDSEPRAPQSLAAYAGMQVLLQALVETNGRTDVATLRRTLQGFDEPEGSLPGGYGVKFDAQGQNQRVRPVLTQWRGDRTVTVFPPAAAGDIEIEDLRGG